MQDFLSRRGERQGVQTSFGLLGKPHKDHRDVIARVPVSRAGDHDAIAMDFPRFAGRLERERHFSPGRKRSRAAEFDSAAVDNYGIRGKGQPGLARLNSDMIQRPGSFKFSRAHTAKAG